MSLNENKDLSISDILGLTRNDDVLVEQLRKKNPKLAESIENTNKSEIKWGEMPDWLK